MSEEFCLPLRVYIEDTDAGGIVYYVNYLKFMERARTEYMRALGFGKKTIFSENLMFVVQDVNVQYRKPAHLDDELVATVCTDKVGGASMVMRQQVRRDAEVLASARVKIVCVNRADLLPARMPRQIINRVRGVEA